MGLNLSDDPISIYDSLYGFSEVSGSSIVCSLDYDIVEVHQVQDLVSSFKPLSSIAFCLMIIFLFSFKCFLDLVKHIIYIMVNK